VPSSEQLSRRGFLGAAGLGALAMAGGLAGCTTGGTLSSDPRELVLWYWNRSLNPDLLSVSEGGIPGMEDLRVRADLIGAPNWDTKLRTTLAGRAYIPDITMINSNCSLYVGSEDLFVDFRELGTAEERERYYDWKVALGTTPSGRQCFWPVDTGPTGFFYRADLFEQAGLPTDPDDVTAAVRTWDDWIAVGAELRAATDSAIVMNALTVFNQFVNASEERYFDREDRPRFTDPDGTIRRAWDTALRAIDAGVTGNLQSGTDQNAGWVSGRVGGHVEGAWWSQVLRDTAPDTTGLWRIAQQPELPGNSGGSFLAVPTTCKDPEAAYAFMLWVTSPENQATTFNDIQLFPSTPGSFTSGIMRNPSDFFADQNPLDVFSAAAEGVPITYISTHESQTGAFGTELTNVESGGKDPDRAWEEAVAQTERVLRKRGVIS
jgi:cellobiose transport system substrate-binding protein